MNTLLRSLRLAILLLCPLLLSPAHAAFNPAVVSADAQWVVFADMHGLRSSVLGREIISTIQKQMPSPPPSLTGMQFDLQRLLATVGNVTAYGTNLAPKAGLIDGALVIEGTGELRKIAEGWAAQASLNKTDGIEETKELPFPGYVLGKELFVGFPAEPIILLGKSAAQLVKAYNVFRGQAPSIANASSPLAQLLSKSGTAYGVAASVLLPDGIAGDAPQARILQLMSSGLATIGEQNQQTIAQAHLVAKSDSNADKLLKIVQGLTAMMGLTETNDRQLAEFLQSAVVERQERTVTVQVAYSSERLAQMIQNATQRQPGQTVQTVQAVRTFGTVLAEWKLDHGTPNVPPSAALLADRVVPNVHLTTGATLTLAGQRAQRGAKDGTAAIDCVEIFPMSGGPGLRFEAENMRLRGYMIRRAPFASGTALIGHFGNFATAQFEFPGAEGDYMVKVRYLEEASGNSQLALSVRAPGAPVPVQSQR
jgi:hypothetical protein